MKRVNIFESRNFSFKISKKTNYILIILISIISIIIANTLFGNIPHSIMIIKNYYVPFIAIPIFIILTIIFIPVDIKLFSLSYIKNRYCE